MKFLIIISLLISSAVFASSTSTPKSTPSAKEMRFKVRKAKSIETTAKRIENLKLMKSCIENTKNKDEMKACHEAHKKLTQKMQSERKAMREAKKKKREAKRAAKKASKNK